MRETIAFKNSSNEWVSRYSYTASCIGWIKDHMVTSPVFTSSQQVLWKHDESAPNNCSFYGCDPVSPAVSFSFNSNPSANKIYKSFSIESPDLLITDSDTPPINTFIVNNGTRNSLLKRVVLNTIKSLGGILYGGVKGTDNQRSNSRVVPVGTISEIIPNIDLDSVLGFGTDSTTTAFVKISGPQSQHSGGESYLLPESSIYDLMNDATDSNYPKIINRYQGGYFVDSPTNLSKGMAVCVAYKNINSDQPKGQFADVSVVFNTDKDFEVHAFNTDFEPTTLDHNS